MRQVAITIFYVLILIMLVRIEAYEKTAEYRIIILSVIAIEILSYFDGLRKK
jgi:hypothetical protein